MIEYSAQEITKAVNGFLFRGNKEARFRGISIDSRKVESGQMFVCIQGEKFDGHDFLKDVLLKNPAGIIVSNKNAVPQAMDSTDTPFVIEVEDTLRALQDCAHFHRMNLPVRVIGITGSNGKSTTKEMISAVLETRFNTLKNQGNFNNHIGLPLTLFSLNQDHEIAVLEMGMSDLGEIKRLAEIARPELGIITNIGHAHLESLKTIQNVQKAKGELFDALDENHTALINVDDPLVFELSKTLRAQKITFSIENPADIKASDIQQKNNAGYDFKVSLFNEEIPLFVPALGKFNIYNALGAIAAGRYFGITAENMVRGLAQCQGLSQRLEVLDHPLFKIINDSYNANPQSMQEALKTLSQFQASGKKYFIVGDMLELGEISQSAHQELGRQIAEANIDFLVTLGPLAQHISRGALDAGMDKKRVASLKTHEDVIQYVQKQGVSGDCLLIKGSRGSRMEKIIEGLFRKEPH